MRTDTSQQRRDRIRTRLESFYAEMGDDQKIDPKTLSTAKKHNVYIYFFAGSLNVRCLTCSQVWSPMLQAGGKLPRQWWKCPRGWECN